MYYFKLCRSLRVPKRSSFSDWGVSTERRCRGRASPSPSASRPTKWGAPGPGGYDPKGVVPEGYVDETMIMSGDALRNKARQCGPDPRIMPQRPPGGW